MWKAQQPHGVVAPFHKGHNAGFRPRAMLIHRLIRELLYCQFSAVAGSARLFVALPESRSLCRTGMDIRRRKKSK
jgi:hypothetical protein